MRLSADLDWFWCCLASPERGILRGTAEGLAVSLFVGIPVAVWDGLWSIYTGCGEVRREAFRSLYGLEIVTITVGDPPVPVEVVRSTDDSFWVVVLAWILLPDAACLSGCQQSTVP